MKNISCEYAGLKLKSPIIAGSCGLTSSVEYIKEMEDAGAGAVVLKSIFEEEITNEYDKLLSENFQGEESHENLDYYDFKIKQDNIENYLKLIQEARKNVSIPVIASINCVSSHEWTYFAKKIETAGADALELNIFLTPADNSKTSNEKENIYFEIIKEVNSKVNIPVIVKMSYYFTDLSGMIKRLSQTEIKGLVLFNRFFSPDIDIDNNRIVPVNIFSSEDELPTSLRWIATASDTAECDLAASTGIHNGEAVIKEILAGAKVVQIASAMYKSGIQVIKEMISELENYMDEKKYDDLKQFRGLMSYKNINNPALYERMQFMKYFDIKKI